MEDANARPQHRLSDIDREARTAWCAGCAARVDVTKAGGARWQCGPANRARVNRQPLRAQVVEAYGGRCNCPGCHVVHAVLLTVDHVNGDGAEHRRRLGGRRATWRWIIAHGFPDDFQLLCGSCNLAKADGDRCPLAGQEH